ncbi:MAG TPA: hypothetical protein V6D17_10255 [Candidatus Obscuribacterales bacterium]
MILEAFADYLRIADPKKPAVDVLAQWLKERLSSPAITNVDRVLHCEISVAPAKSSFHGFKTSFVAAIDGQSLIFKGSSQSGRRLLKSLYEYCQSYDQQKWARFVHNLKASDFNQDEIRDLNS